MQNPLHNAKRKDHPSGWSFLLLGRVTDLDAFVKIHRCKLLQYHILPTGERKDWRTVLH